MRIRFSNALLWRGLDATAQMTDFEVADGLVADSIDGVEPDRFIDLKSSFTMPAFRDGHCHPLFAGREHLGADVTTAKNLDDISHAIRSYAQTHPEHAWIDGAVFDKSIDAGFTRQELDAIVPDRPVVLHGADHHTLWVNTAALKVAGLMDSRPKTSAGFIDLDDTGSPTGILREWDAMKLVLDAMPKQSLEQELDSLDWAQNSLLKLGVVEVQEAWIDPGMAEIYIASAKAGRLRVSTNLAFRADPETWRRDFGYFESVIAQVATLEHPMLRANSIKFFVDGVLGSSTASLIEPYVAGPQEHFHGEQVWVEGELIEAAARANLLGLQLHLHAIGDQAVRTALNVVESVKPDLSAVVAHTEMVSDIDIPRFSKLNVIANFQPLWAREDGQLLSCAPQLGRSRLDAMYRMRDLVDSGAHLSFGSDWPVSSPDPIQGLATAVTRKLPHGSSFSIHQALTTQEALNAYTTGVARQLGRANRSGALQPGQPADFVVLSGNPFDGPNDALFYLKVERLFIQGEEF